MILDGDYTSYRSGEIRWSYDYNIGKRLFKIFALNTTAYLILGSIYYEFIDSMINNSYYKLIVHGLLWFP
jgi:hypothetical protein